MSPGRTHAPRTVVRDSAAVSPLELFFDLVFVFALTQVTAAMAADLTAQGLLEGLLVVALLWWSWTGYAWVGNTVRADEGVARLVVLAAMAVMFVLALAIPEAFDDLPGGLSGPVVVALSYAAFRLLHLTLYWVASGDDPGLRNQVLRFAPSVVVATTLLLLAAGTDGRAQTGLWVAALAADYGGTFAAGAAGWRIRSAGHFSERHGLIVIVALGESIVALGVGVAELPIAWPVVVGAALGLSVSAALWWAYFDVGVLLAERALAAAPEQDRARMARDAYSYLHLPLVAGVVLLALGLKKVLELVGDTAGHELTDPLTGIGLLALLLGPALFLLAHVAFIARTVGVVNRARLVAAVALVASMPLVSELPALGALGWVAGVTVAVSAYETVHWSDDRERVRHGEGEAPDGRPAGGTPLEQTDLAVRAGVARPTSPARIADGHVVVLPGPRRVGPDPPPG